MVKAIIFDVDGTLVDSVDLHARAWVDAFGEFGHDVAFADVRQQIGKGGDQLLPVFLSEAEIEAKGKALNHRRSEILKERYLSQIRSFPKVRELFLRIRQDDTAIVLASSAKGDELETYKKVCNIEDLITAQTSSDDAERSKPHPDIFEAAMNRLDGVDADEVLVIGDTPYDAEAAAKAGLRTVGVLCGGFPEQQLRDAGCMAIYNDPEHLLREYENSPLAKQHS